MAEWRDAPIYQEVCARHLFDPLPAAPNPLDLTDPASRPDGSWCEDRDPRSDWELTDMDGRE